MAEYYDLNPFKVDYFTKCSEKYSGERTVFECFSEEAFNKFGIQSRYYPVTTNKDKVFGEGNNKLVVRSFDFMPYTENGQLPYEGRTVSPMGILSTDLFNIHISIRNFNVMSTYNTTGTSGIYPSYEPMIGDIIYFKYNKKFYRVLMVKLETEMFLQGKHTYTLVLEMLRDVSYNFSNELLMASDPIIDINPTNKDLFALNDYIDQVKQNILYQPKISECPPNDPFNDWVATPQTPIEVDNLWDGGIENVDIDRFVFYTIQNHNSPSKGLNEYPDVGVEMINIDEYVFSDGTYADNIL